MNECATQHECENGTCESKGTKVDVEIEWIHRVKMHVKVRMCAQKSESQDENECVAEGV